MAVTPQDADQAFLREVDEGVRRDQVTSLWRRYGIAAVVVVVLLLAGLGGWLYWQDAEARRAGVAGEDLAQAISKLEVGDAAAARPVFDRLATDGPEGYRALALLMQAADAVGAGDDKKAIRLLDAVAADDSQPPPLRDAALVKAVRLGFDTLPPATVVARLKPLSLPGNPWFGVAGEMTALAHLKAGNPALAKPLLTAIVRDATSPPTLRSRTAQLALSLGVDPATLDLPKVAPTAVGPAPAAAPAPPSAAAPTAPQPQ